MRRAPGGFGSRMGAPWSVAWSTDRRRAEDRVSQHTAASTQEATTAPSREAIALAVDADVCPFCGAGPYESVGQHTSKAHGVSAAELRELAGLERVCSEELSASSRDRLVNRPDRDEISSRGGRESMRRQRERGWAGNRDTTPALAASMAPRLEVIAERDPIILKRAAEGHRLIDIATDLGVTTMTVQRTLKRHGVKPDLRQTNAERRRRLMESQEAARLATAARNDAEWARKSDRFKELGADWSALCAVAAEEGVTRKAMRAYFAKRGIVLDGRKG